MISPQKNPILGAALIIAGTAIGAGMLAMPLTSAEMGFGMTLLLLSSLWLLLTYTAFLFIELYQYEPKNAGIAMLASRYFGENGRLFVDFTLLLFMYALLTAYITASGDLLQSILPIKSNSAESIVENRESIQKWSALIFASLFGVIVTIGVTLADRTNRLFFFLQLVIFGVVLYLLLNRVSMSNLTAAPLDSRLFLSGASIFFMAFGFHICLPTVNEMLDGDTKAVKKATLIGSLLVLFIYLIWQFTTHGVLNQTLLVELLRENPTLSGLTRAFKSITGSREIEKIVELFSILAITTSYIGVSLGLANAVKSLLERFKLPKWPLLVGILTFFPPILVAFTHPTIFLRALAYAGVIFAFIGVILPVILVMKSRLIHPDGVRTKGGRWALWLALGMAAIIIVTPFLVDLGLLPSVANP